MAGGHAHGMTRPRATVALALVALLAAASSADAQAWLRWDQSASSMGRGGAAAADARDASAAFYNPAGIATLFGTHVRVDAIASRRGGEFRAFGAGSFERDPDLELAGGVYATHTVTRALTLGLAINSPWRHSVEWDRPDAFVGRFRATGTSLRSVVVSPILAWQALPDLAVGGGPVVTYGVLEIDRFEQDPDLSAIGGAGPIALARSHYSLDGLAPGWVVGASWRIDDALSIGAHARGGTEIDLVGPVGFEDVAPQELRDFVLRIRDSVTVGEILDQRYVSQEVLTRLSLPMVVSGGLAWSPLERVRVTGDLQWIGWSDSESFDLDFANDSLDDRQPLAFEDSWTIRAGVEVRHRPGQVMRLGFAHVGSPVPTATSTPLVPDADRDEVSAGVGLTWRGVGIDLAYRIAFLTDREGVALPEETSPDGIFESTEHSLAVGVSRRF